VANSTIGIDEPTTIDKRLDTESLTVGVNTVERERVQVTGAAATEVARVQATAPAGTEMALVTRNIPSGTQPVSGPLTDTELRASAVPVSGTFWQATQPVSAAALPLPAGAATEATLAAVDTKLGGSLAVTGTFWQATQPVSGPLTDTQLRATAVPVSGSFYQATQPVSAASLPLPTGAAAEATLASVKTAVETLDNAIAGTEMQVDVVAALPAGTNIIGAALNAGPSGTPWSTTHEPAANTQATITRAAAGVGVKNVCTGLTVTFAAGATAPAAVQVAVRLRDGGTGAGTVLWAAVLSLPATAGASVGVARQGLWIPGTANTAMTLEFSAAGGANTIQAVALEGTTAS
jgi:hypothetical protein